MFETKMLCRVHPRLLLALGAVLWLAPACAKKTTPRGPRAPAPARQTHVGERERGLASWYGEPYHGRLAANGERYDMDALTAAHRTLPFDTRARITHETNGRSVEVRITDRGPFVEDRFLDLSREAARRLGMLEAGVAPVELVVTAVPAARFAVQAGAFREPARAHRLRDELARRHAAVRVEPPGAASSFYRVLVGNFASRDDAGQLARDLQRQGGVATVVLAGTP